MSSCDEAWAEYNLARHEYESTQELVQVFGLTAVASAALLAATLGLFVLGLTVTASGPQAAFLPIVLVVLLVVMGAASVAALVSSLVFAVWLAKLYQQWQRREQAYAALWNKCQSEPDRIPTYESI